MSARHLLPFVALTMLVPGARAPQRTAAPPDEPAQIELGGDSIRIRYNGSLMFDGRVVNPAALRDARTVVARTAGDAVDQAIAFHAKGGAGALEIAGRVTASEEASFPCESDRAFRALQVVRHSSGLSRSFLNQAVYDRKWDWPRHGPCPSRLESPAVAMITVIEDRDGERRVAELPGAAARYHLRRELPQRSVWRCSGRSSSRSASVSSWSHSS